MFGFLGVGQNREAILRKYVQWFILAWSKLFGSGLLKELNWESPLWWTADQGQRACRPIRDRANVAQACGYRYRHLKLFPFYRIKGLHEVMVGERWVGTLGHGEGQQVRIDPQGAELTTFKHIVPEMNIHHKIYTYPQKKKEKKKQISQVKPKQTVHSQNQNEHVYASCFLWTGVILFVFVSKEWSMQLLHSRKALKWFYFLWCFDWIRMTVPKF